MKPTWAVDISTHQSDNVDFAKLKSLGVESVIVRVTYGKGADTRAKKYVAAAKAAGLLVYAYGYTVAHYASVSGNNINAAVAYVQQEMDTLASLMKHYGCDMVAGLDMELADKGSATNFTGVQLTQIANAGMDRLALHGILPVFYASLSWTIDRMGMTNPKYGQWPAYWVSQNSYFHNHPNADGSFPSGRYGEQLRKWRESKLLAFWQWGGGTPASMGPYYGFASSNGLDRDFCYLEQSPIPATQNMLFATDNRVEYSWCCFGWTRGGGTVFHAGIDVDTTGDPTIYSTVSGKVKWARLVLKNTPGWGQTWQWGYFVWVIADDGTDHIFAHCKKESLMVKEGERVTAGQTIAIMGMTGNASKDYTEGTIPNDVQGEHCHYEVRRNGESIDPTPWCHIPNKVGVTMNNGGQPAPTEGVQMVTTVDVYATISHQQGVTERRANVQFFGEPDAWGTLLSDDSKQGLPDGRYWCNRTGITMAGVDSTKYKCAEIYAPDRDGNTVKGYVLIYDGATEITQMPNEEAYQRFVVNQNNSYDDSELQTIKKQFEELQEAYDSQSEAFASMRQDMEEIAAIASGQK